MIRSKKEFIEKAKVIVGDYIQAHMDKIDDISSVEVIEVWYYTTLQNYKALLTTTLFDGLYYEVTYNGIGDENEIYLDVYKKFEKHQAIAL